MVFYKKDFIEAICITSGHIQDHDFKEGEIFPICGGNNGLQLVFENKKSDAEVLYLFNFGSYLAYPDDGIEGTPRFSIIGEL